MEKNTCAFTGHRPKSFPWKYDETAPGCVQLKEALFALRLHCILPCQGQEDKWPAAMQEQYRSILQRADEVLCLQEEYSDDCMAKRNRHLVDHAAVLLAVYNGTRRSGTGMTLRYAQRQGREIFILDPISRGMTRIRPASGQ